MHSNRSAPAVSLRLFSGLLAAWTAVAAAEPPLRDPYDVDFAPIADDIYVAIRPESTRQPVMGNGIVIVNDDHVVVVDGNGSPLLAERVIAHIRSVTGLPVRYLIVSHWHGDHNLGNHRYVEAYPGITIVGHQFTRQAMRGATMDYVEEYKTGIPGQLEALAVWLQAGAGPDGEPLLDYQRSELEDLVKYTGVFVQETRASRVTPPNLTFESGLVLHGGGRTIEVRRLARGNTAGDAVVWLPTERILLSGDIVVHPTPYGFYSYPRSWAGVLRELQALEPRIVVPGHGPVMRDTRYLALLEALFDDIAGQAERAVSAGHTLDDFKAAFDIDAWRARFTADDPWLDSRFRVWFSQPIAEAAYNEAAGLESEVLLRPEAPAAANGGAAEPHRD